MVFLSIANQQPVRLFGTLEYQITLYLVYELAIVYPVSLHCDLVKKKVSTSVNLVISFSPAVFKNQIFFLLNIPKIFIVCAEKMWYHKLSKIVWIFLKMIGFKNIGLGNNFYC